MPDTAVVRQAGILVAIAMFPGISFGCMGGNYDVYHQDGFAMLGIGLIAIVVAIFVRTSRRVLRWYLPAVVFLLAAALPAIQWWDRYSGDCGIGFYESSVRAAAIAFLYLLYELVGYWYERRKARQRDAA